MRESTNQQDRNLSPDSGSAYRDSKSRNLSEFATKTSTRSVQLERSKRAFPLFWVANGAAKSARYPYSGSLSRMRSRVRVPSSPPSHLNQICCTAGQPACFTAPQEFLLGNHWSATNASISEGHLREAVHFFTLTDTKTSPRLCCLLTRRAQWNKI